MDVSVGQGLAYFRETLLIHRQCPSEQFETAAVAEQEVDLVSLVLTCIIFLSAIVFNVPFAVYLHNSSSADFLEFVTLFKIKLKEILLLCSIRPVLYFHTIFLHKVQIVITGV